MILDDALRKSHPKGYRGYVSGGRWDKIALYLGARPDISTTFSFAAIGYEYRQSIVSLRHKYKTIIAVSNGRLLIFQNISTVNVPVSEIKHLYIRRRGTFHPSAVGLSTSGFPAQGVFVPCLDFADDSHPTPRAHQLRDTLLQTRPDLSVKRLPWLIRLFGFGYKGVAFMPFVGKGSNETR